MCCYKRGCKPRYKPKPKHPAKVHVCEGISHHGRTSLCIFKEKWMPIICINFFPYILSIFMETIKGQRSKNVKVDPSSVHQGQPFFCSSRTYIQMVIISSRIAIWSTAQSFHKKERGGSQLVANSSGFSRYKSNRQFWHELQEYIRREVKPTLKADLIAGIKEFWETETVEKHLKTFIPVVVECQGAATGYWLHTLHAQTI